MNQQSWLAPMAIVVAIITESALSGPLSAQVSGAGPATKDVFGLTRVHEFHIELTANGVGDNADGFAAACRSAAKKSSLRSGRGAARIP